MLLFKSLLWHSKIRMGKMVSGRTLFAALTLTILACVCSHAEGRPQGAHILGFVLPGPYADPSLQQVLSESFAVQLTRRKLTVQLGDAVTSGEFKLRDALRLTSAQDAQYLVVATYTTTPTVCGLEINLYDPADGGMLRSGKASGRIDLSLDAIMAQALSTALSGIGFREQPNQTVVPADAGPRPPGQWRLLELSAEAAPLFAIGAVSQYAKIGLLADLSLDYRFPLGTAVLEAGLLTGVCLMGATGAVTDAAILLVPIGIDVQYAMNAGSFPGVTLHVSGGPAVMSINAAYLGDSLTKIVPYLLAGLTLDLPFSPVFGIAFEARYVAFLESSLPIMAFAPTVRMFVQL